MPKIKTFTLILGVLIMSFLVGYLVFGWTEPAQTPPGCTPGQPGCDAPINISSNTQTKTGALRVTRLEDTDLTGWFIDPSLDEPNISAVFRGRVGIGTTGPNQKLSVAGTLGIIEGGASPSFYTIFQGGDQTANITYTLPTAYPTASEQVLSSATTGVMSWVTAGGGGAPVDATYITQTANATLTAEQALSTLSTGYMKVTTVTGVVSSQAVPIPATDGGTGQTTWTTGDILYASAANTLAKRAIGSAGQVLTVSGGVPVWAAAPSGFADPMTTAGDIIIRNASNTTTRLGIGSAGQVLTVSGGVPTWAAAPGGGFTCSPTCTSSYLTKFTGASTIGNSLVFDNGTQVGIGTSSPDINYRLTIDSTDATKYGIKVVASSTQPAAYITNTGTGYGLIIDSGNVGIGTTSPGTNKLEVVGGPIKATGGLIIETRTSDPATPVSGQIWLRTDL